jgi:hypothetical protein
MPQQPDRQRPALFESLESRQHFAATPAPLPDLQAKIVFTPPSFVRPGGTVKPVLEVRNIGASMTKMINVLINFYVSTTPKLPANAEPYETIKSENLKVAANTTKNLTLTTSVPADISAGKFYLHVSINEEPKGLKEAKLTNNFARTKPLTTPLGTYAGRFAGTNALFGSLSIRLSPIEEDGKGILADLTARTNAGTFVIPSIRATIKPKGAFTLADKGVYLHPTLGRLNYRVVVVGKIEGKTFTGNFRLNWRSATDSRITYDESVQLKRP